MRTPIEIMDTLRDVARARIASFRRHDAEFWRRFAYAGATYSPEWFRRMSPPIVGTGFYFGMRQMREAVVHNQAVLLGLDEHSLAAHLAARRVFAEFARCLADALEMSGKPDLMFGRDYVDEHYLIGAMAKKRGSILVTAHTGSWEVGGRMLKFQREVPVTMVMAEETNPNVRRYVDELRKRSGVNVLYAKRNDPSTAVTLLSRLRKGETVAIQIDRIPESEKVIETRLAGAKWLVPEGPFRLAQASGAPIIPVFLRRSGHRRYTFTIAKPIEIERRATPERIQAAAQQATSALEDFVRENPEQWFHFAPLPPPEQ